MDPAHERDKTLASLQAAAARVGGTVKARLIPQEGISFGFALRGARDGDGIAAVNIGRSDGNHKNAASVTSAFSTDEPVVPVILTAMKFDPALRSAAILQYSDRAIGVFENDLFLECARIGRAAERPGISTMDWGIASCCKDGIPDVICRMGGSMKESRLILFGEGPADVANNIIICSNRI